MNKQNKLNDNANNYVDNLGYLGLSPHMKTWLYTWHRMGYKLVSPKECSHRISLCRLCSWWSENKHMMKCSKCNCGSEKMLLKDSHCPLQEPKW